MNEIINFIKEALEGKKMSASWIVTLGIAIGGLVWAGMLAMQEYEGVKTSLTKLEAQAHTEVTAYNDEEVIRKISKNKDEITLLREKTRNLENNLNRTDRAVQGSNNPLSL